VRLARLAALAPGMRVLDVGGGVGGPARTLAVEFGCRVTAIDLTETFVQAAKMLTVRLGLGAQVTHEVGNALALPFDGGVFDVVWTQNSGMKIADKPRLYAGSTACSAPAASWPSRSRWTGPPGPSSIPSCGRATPRRASCARPRRCAR
jgi:SAM-dependent methyltransferase